jgi:signal transduction histidine kinase
MTGLRRALVGIGVAGLAAGGAITFVVAHSDYATARGAFVAVSLVLGWSFIGTGLYAWHRRPENGTGTLMVAVGFAWFFQPLAASTAAVVFAVAYVLLNTFYAVLIHLLLAFPHGRLEGRRDRRIAGAAYFVAIGLQIPPLLFIETPNDDYCDGCPENLLLVMDSMPTAQAMTALQALPAIAIFVAAGMIVIRRWRAARGAQRAALAPVVWAGVAMLVMATFQLVAGVALQEGATQLFYFGVLLAMAAVPYGFLLGLLRSRISRAGAVSELVGRLGRAPAGERELRDALSDALGDPSLTLAYWLPDAEEWVDAEGRRVPDPTELAGVEATLVRHEGRTVAALLHDPRLRDEPELLETVTAAAALTLENQRLDAALRARVEELRESRARIVEAGYAARRRLERDLHDGAQQRLVALALDLRLARSKLDRDPAAAAELLDASIGELAQATNELRELARGIHPAVLSDRGLSAALDALASRAPLPVELGAIPAERLPEPVETAAYFVVAEALTNVARYAEATHAEVTVERANGTLRVEVRDDGIGGADPAAGTGLRGLEDRLAALDGRLEVSSPDGSGTVVRAEVPCA